MLIFEEVTFKLKPKSNRQARNNSVPGEVHGQSFDADKTKGHSLTIWTPIPIWPKNIKGILVGKDPSILFFLYSSNKMCIPCNQFFI